MTLLPVFESDRMNQHVHFSTTATAQTQLHLVAKDLDSDVVQDLTAIVNFMRKDPDRIVFRRFSRANLYNLLVLQHRLTLIDQRIASYEGGDTEALIDILPILESSVKSYNKALLSYRSVLKMTETPQSLVETLQASTTESISELNKEFDPENGWNELISIAEIQRGWAHKIVGKHVWLQKLFRQTEKGVSRSTLFTYSAKNVRRAEEALLNLSFCILVITPIFVLSYASQRFTKLVVVLVFTCVTSVVASCLSDKTQKTSLALMAGYTAVLVVFLSNNVGDD